jgi:hypothetical protein
MLPNEMGAARVGTIGRRKEIRRRPVGKNMIRTN